MTFLKFLCGGAIALGLAACGANGAGETEPADQNAEPKSTVADDFKVTPGAGPALWKVHDDDTQIYMFGTVHVLPPDLKWRTKEFDAAFDVADTIYFEAEVDDQDPKMAILVAQLGTMPPGQNLFDLLTAEEKEELISAAESVKIPIASLSRLKPWLVGITISLQQIIAEGQDPNSGVEMVLIPEAKADGKKLRFFETAEQQLHFLADLPDEVQVEFLMDGVRQIKDVPDLIAKMDDAWVNGDIDALGELLLTDESIAGEQVYEVMLLNRNKNWADELAKLAKDEAGVFMVAVGAAHLAGEDSVVLMLEKGGLKVDRVQ